MVAVGHMGIGQGSQTAMSASVKHESVVGMYSLRESVVICDL